MKYTYGWRKQRVDVRDYKAHELDFLGFSGTLPSSFDLRPGCPPVYDQGQLGSCTANGIAGALEYDLIAQKKPAFIPSRLFIYFLERSMEGTVAYDAGAAIRDGAKAVNQFGFCDERLWPYNIGRFTQQPPQSVYDAAKPEKVTNYAAVTQDITALKKILAGGRPVVFGFIVYQSFERGDVARSGVMPMPGTFDWQVGGHCVAAVGYDDAKQVVICRNSWGPSWGDKGYFYMPYAYITNPNLASDFWVFYQVP